jgi:ADP-ribose pyrophosphatase
MTYVFPQIFACIVSSLFFRYIQKDGRFLTPSMMTDIHVKCRDPYEYVYQDRGQVRKIKRHNVPAGMISWDVLFEFYDPMIFDAPHLATAPYADPDIKRADFKPSFNSLDGRIDRRSYEGPYRVTSTGPLNIRGRTGLRGRGVLGRYGPNHAADPIVTRWKRHPEGGIRHDSVSQRPILQFVAIQRRDTSEWALPGGMVDPGENVSVTLMREFMEEALDSGTMGSKDKVVIESRLRGFFEAGKEIYKVCIKASSLILLCLV